MNPSKAKQAQAQRKYHEKKFGDAAYRERRKEIQIRYRLNAKQKKKIRVGSEEQHPSSLEETHPRVDVVETLPITTWTCASHIELTEQLPKCGKGEVSTCPRTLVGDNAIAAFALEGISSYLQNHWKSEEMTELLSVAEYDIPNITGLRTITGNRYEFYVRVKNSTPAAFYTLLRYSERQRRDDPHLELTDVDMCKLVGQIVAFATFRAHYLVTKSIYDLQNFAYIVSFGDVEQQDVHIDLCDINHYQLAMLCSPVGELTNEYRCTDSEFNHVEGDNLTKLWADLPPSLQVKLNKITEIQTLIDGFGPLLSPPSIELVGAPCDMVAFGTMLLLPGRVMHCGPKVTRQNTVTGNNMLRSVMFLTATPKNNLASAYDSEIQYCRSTIIHDILLYSWPSLNAKEKKYMLTKWEEVGLSNDSIFAITINMKHIDLKVIALELKRTPKDKMKSIISRIANDPVWKGKGHRNRWDRVVGGQPYKIPISK